jgi:hypothetical protein
VRATDTKNSFQTSLALRNDGKPGTLRREASGFPF